jgi:hypothetical protein
MVRITHRATVMRKFGSYNRETHPIAFAIYFSAINSLPPKVVHSKFQETKEALLDRFQLGVEISLARENYLTSSSLEIFQGFVLWLTCITREEDMGKLPTSLGSCGLLTCDRKSVGASGYRVPHCPQSRSSPRSISVSEGIYGCHYNRVTKAHVASVEPLRVPSSRM